MPYKSENKRIPPDKDKRRKLSEEDKESIRKMEGYSQRELARMFGVSRRTIQFVLDPKKRESNVERRKERGGWRLYYDKDKHAEYTRRHRRYKNEIFKEEN
jgi:transposase